MTRVVGAVQRPPRRAGILLMVALLMSVSTPGPVAAGSVPPNDTFAQATPVTALPFTASVSVAGAQREGSEPGSSCSTAHYGTVWYRVHLGSAASVRIDTVGSSFDAALDVFTGSSLGTLTLIACDEDIDSLDPTLDAARLTFRAAANTNYYVRMSWDSAGSDGVFHARTVTRPANDDYANAQQITSLPFVAEASTAVATAEPNEPRPVGSNGCAHSWATRWYRFTPSKRTTLQIETFGTEFDTVLGVFRGSSLGSAVKVICNDDTLYQGKSVRASSVTFTASAGVEYRIAVGGHDGDNGTFDLAVRSVTPVANDDFAHAAPIQYVPSRIATNTRRATRQSNDPSSCRSENTVWYRYVAPESSGVQFDALGVDGTFGFVGVYTGSSLSQLQLLACGSGAGVATRAGTTYWIQVGWYGSTTGPLTFDVSPYQP